MIAKQTSASRGAATPIDSRSRERAKRRRLGIFYTPPELVEPILDETLEPILAGMRTEESCRERLANLRIIDPACGSGHFLLGAWRRLAGRIAAVAPGIAQRECLKIAAASMHGIDIDPAAGVAGALLLREECSRWGLSPRDFQNWFTLGDGLLEAVEGDGLFDLVVGNPPFIDSESMCRSDRARRNELAQNYSTARGNWDLASLFVERAVRLARPGGRIGLVLPRRLIASDHAQHIQNLMGQQTIESIRVNDASAFEDATVETINLVLRRDSASRAHCIHISKGNQLHSFAQRDLDRLPPGHWSAIFAYPDPRVTGFKPLLQGLPRLSEHAFVGDGATTAEAYRIRDVIVEQATAPGDSVRLVNTGTIDPFTQLWGRRPTRYLRSTWTEPAVPARWLAENLPRRAAQACSPKVLVAGLAGRIEALVDDGAALCGKSAVQVIPADPLMCHALCAWLNSGAINDLYRLLFESRGFGSRSMHIGPRQLEQLPVWRIDDPTHVKAATELASLSRSLHEDAGAEGYLQRVDGIVRALLA